MSAQNIKKKKKKLHFPYHPFSSLPFKLYNILFYVYPLMLSSITAGIQGTKEEKEDETISGYVHRSPSYCFVAIEHETKMYKYAEGVSVEGTNKFSSHNDTIKVSCGSVHTVSRVAEGWARGKQKLSANSAHTEAAKGDAVRPLKWRGRSVEN